MRWSLPMTAWGETSTSATALAFVCAFAGLRATCLRARSVSSVC